MRWPAVVFGVLILVLLAAGVWYGLSLSANPFIRQLKEAEAVLQKEPDNFSALMDAGQATYNLKRYSKAVDYYTRATQVKPSEAVAWNNLANVKRDLKRFSDAEKDYQKALTLAPKEVQYHTNLADLYRLWAKEDPEKGAMVEETLLQALKALPGNPRLINMLISYYEAKGELKKADEWWATDGR